MPTPSPSIDAAPRARAARQVGIGVLALVQVGFAVLAATMLTIRYAGQVSQPPRAERRRAIDPATVPSIPIPTVFGWVERLTDGGLWVTAISSEQREVRIDGLTVVFTGGQPGQLADVYPGMTVTILGEIEPDGRVLADVVLLSPPP
jgi:hypothetical protein